MTSFRLAAGTTRRNTALTLSIGASTQDGCQQPNAPTCTAKRTPNLKLPAGWCGRSNDSIPSGTAAVGAAALRGDGGVIALRNEHGVVIVMKSMTQGASLKPAGGIKLRLTD